jgi:hypothetical protein
MVSVIKHRYTAARYDVSVHPTDDGNLPRAPVLIWRARRRISLAGRCRGKCRLGTGGRSILTDVTFITASTGMVESWCRRLASPDGDDTFRDEWSVTSLLLQANRLNQRARQRMPQRSGRLIHHFVLLLVHHKFQVPNESTQRDANKESNECSMIGPSTPLLPPALGPKVQIQAPTNAPTKATRHFVSY